MCTLSYNIYAYIITIRTCSLNETKTRDVNIDTHVHLKYSVPE